MKRILNWLRTIYMSPFLLMLMVGEGEVTGEVKPDGEDHKETPTPEEVERQAAIARGDIIPEDKDDLDIDTLKGIAGEETPAGDDDKDEKFVPKGRFNEVNNEKKAALEENARLKAELAATKGGKTEPSAEEIAAAEKAELENPTTVAGMKAKSESLQEIADELLLDPGAHEGLNRKDVLKEINRLTIEIAKAEIRAETSVEKTQADIQKDIDSAVSDSLSLYPFLDPDHEKSNADLNNDIIAYRDGKIKQGMPYADALRKAVEKFAPAYARENGFTVDTAKADEIKAAREKKALAKAADASLRQPSKLPSKAEKETFTIDPSKLSKKQIDAMPEEEKARMRGDVL